jgi:hypothetical protein
VTYVTDGIESAVAQAKAAAGDKDRRVVRTELPSEATQF